MLHSLQDQGGHFGVDKTIDKVSEICWWPGYTKDIQTYIHTCQQCARKKQPKNPIQADLQSIPIGGPMEMLAMDFVGPLPTSNKGINTVLDKSFEPPCKLVYFRVYSTQRTLSGIIRLPITVGNV